MALIPDFKRMSFRHKNNKPLYYTRNYIRQYLPIQFYQARLQRLLAGFDRLDKAEQDYIQKRVDYYNRLSSATLSDKAQPLSELKLGKKQKVYFFDAFEFTRYFKSTLKAIFVFGDVIHVPDEPAIVKSRPIRGDNTNSVVLKLEKLRHFLFVNDKKSFTDKSNRIISRGKAAGKEHRLKFLEMYYQHPMCDVGQVDRGDKLYPAPRMTLGEHLNYKFIMCLEGNDVASNLKWVMSSNSLAVMPLPTYETWFMEGTLIPDYHYVLIKDDYSDLEERMNYYIEHPDKAQQIIENAHEYIRQFKNKRRENLISLMVLDKYFKQTGQQSGN
ncbi:MAG: hypothetical protein RIS29_295 [Bacteroidota bacterium]|jgi:hypothetical protein